MLCWPWIQDNLITWPKISYRKKNESCDVERNYTLAKTSMNIRFKMADFRPSRQLILFLGRKI